MVKIIIRAIPWIWTLVLIAGCVPTRIIRQERRTGDSLSFQTGGQFVKVHMNDGCLYVLNSSNKIQASDTLTGLGTFYGPERKIREERILTKEGNGYYFNAENGLRKFMPAADLELFKIPFRDIALVETNDIEGVRGKLLGITLVGIPNTVMLFYCIANPKACFGSCPTFYAPEENDMSLMAEGFSSSILKSYEKRDIDMLYRTRANGNRFHLRLTNEALETHMIRSADLLVFPRTAKERIFSTAGGDFYKTDFIRKPAICYAAEGSILEKVASMDHQERFVPADSNDLLKKEEIGMEFDSLPPGDLGLVVGCRQTFLTTYLFYQSLAYLGSTAGLFAARIESGDTKLQARVDRIWDLLGGIEVLVQNDRGQWEQSGEIQESGPIAADVHLVRLPAGSAKNLKVKLRMTKGLWRVDYLALCRLNQRVEPVVVSPSEVMGREGIDDRAKAQLCDPGETLITLPGDIYDLYYDLPGISEDYEIYLSSQGYYIEWMRESWLEEEDLKKAALMFGFPKLFMKVAAPQFKEIESSMEEDFWRSKYVRQD